MASSGFSSSGSRHQRYRFYRRFGEICQTDIPDYVETDAFNSRLIFKFMSRHRGGCDRSTWSKAFIRRALSLSFSRIYDYQIVNSLMKTHESHHFMHFFRSLNLDTDVIKYVCRLLDVIFVHLRISRMI